MCVFLVFLIYVYHDARFRCCKVQHWVIETAKLLFKCVGFKQVVNNKLSYKFGKFVSIRTVACWTRHAMHVQRNMEARSLNDCYRGKARSITYSEWVFVVLVIRHTKGIFPVILSSVACSALPHFTTLYHNGTILGLTVADISPRTPEFGPRLSLVGFVVNKAGLEAVALRVLQFFPCSIIPTSHLERLNLVPD